MKLKPRQIVELNEKNIREFYDNSFLNNKKAWRKLVSASEDVGWKDIYFMILKLQELKRGEKEAYRLLPSRR